MATSAEGRSKSLKEEWEYIKKETPDISWMYAPGSLLHTIWTAAADHF